MRRTEELNRLFAEWEGSKPGYLQHFSPDGIVDEASYERARRRLLFILWEPHGHHEDLRDHASNFAAGKDRSNATWRNLAYWSYGLLRGFPSFTQLLGDQNHLAALNEIAVMNIKKTSGGSPADQHGIINFARDAENRAFIRRELEIIQPEVVVTCGDPVSEPIREILDSTIPWSRTPNHIDYFSYKSYLVVAYYHPRRLVPNPMGYAYLIGELRTLLPQR